MSLCVESSLSSDNVSRRESHISLYNLNIQKRFSKYFFWGLQFWGFKQRFENYLQGVPQFWSLKDLEGNRWRFILFRRSDWISLYKHASFFLHSHDFFRFLPNVSRNQSHKRAWSQQKFRVSTFCSVYVKKIPNMVVLSFSSGKRLQKVQDFLLKSGMKG